MKKQIFAFYATNLQAFPKIKHGFFTRQGGVSQGPYSELNCGYGIGDEDENVQQNRALVEKFLDLALHRTVSLNQTHGAHVVSIDRDSDLSEVMEGDGLVTSRATMRGLPITLSILTADCVPILLVDPVREVIGAAHAGWRSALQGIVECTLATMTAYGAELKNVVAAIGPSIHQENYEVGPEVVKQFIAQSPNSKMYFKPSQKAGYALFDLPGYVKGCLKEAGINDVEGVDQDTYSAPDLFFSHRRAFHKGEKAHGNQISLISFGDV